MRTAVTSTLAAIALSIPSPDASASDFVVYNWPELASQGCTMARMPQPECEKSIALVRTAMRSAAEQPGGAGLLDRAAAAVTAYVILEHFFPEQQADFEVKLAVVLADVPETQAKADALARGRRVATELLRRRGVNGGAGAAP